MDQLVVNTPSGIENDIEDFRLDRLDEKDNYTIAQVKLCRKSDDGTPILFYSQNLSRNFREQGDPLGSKRIMKVFTPSNHEAVADETLTHKFQDTLLAFKDRIYDYSPLSDIHSRNMKLFMDENTAQFVSDIGINVDGLDSDFSEMESVPASPFMEDASHSASTLKSELMEIQDKLASVKSLMANEFEEYLDIDTTTDEDFEERLAFEVIPDRLVQQYLAVKEKLKTVREKLGIVNQEVFSETSSLIKLPKRIKEVEYDLFR